MPTDTVDHEYEKPANLRTIDFRPDTHDSQWPDRRKFWIQRRFNDEMVRIGFPEPDGFIAREYNLEELIEALEELRDFEEE